MELLFSNCSSLRTLDLSSFNASNVINMRGLFENCSSLESVNLSNFKTTNTKYMSGMFVGCWNLRSLDLTSFNTGRVENMANMFNDCINLKNVNLAGFDASHVKSFRSMFSNCRSLENVNLSVSDTCKPENLTYMFYQCGSLKSIDLYGFNTANIGKDQNLYMFYGCTSLDEMKLSADFFNGDMTDSHPYSDETKWVQLSLKPNVKSWQEMTQSWDENDAGYWGLLHDSVFLHFDTNGGSEMDSLQMNPGSSFAAGSYIPLKPGYAFTGWFLDPECTEQIDDCCILNFDLTLYAGWKVKHYTIMFDTNCGLIDSYTGVYGSSHDISGFKLDFFNGKFFTGWYTDPECTHKAEDQFILTEDITFYAGWE
ncbi:MAG: BspA family leucine-rich repeat surface protein [Erysipelotrichaceae bacterium]|nr:BspA family leucine-rich repeat surface protein [Erysipelotrichaceae bacterium]